MDSAPTPQDQPDSTSPAEYAQAIAELAVLAGISPDPLDRDVEAILASALEGAVQGAPR